MCADAFRTPGARFQRVPLGVSCSAMRRRRTLDRCSLHRRFTEAVLCAGCGACCFRGWLLVRAFVLPPLSFAELRAWLYQWAWPGLARCAAALYRRNLRHLHCAAGVVELCAEAEPLRREGRQVAHRRRSGVRRRARAGQRRGGLLVCEIVRHGHKRRVAAAGPAAVPRRSSALLLVDSGGVERHVASCCLHQSGCHCSVLL